MNISKHGGKRSHFQQTYSMVQIQIQFSMTNLITWQLKSSRGSSFPVSSFGWFHLSVIEFTAIMFLLEEALCPSLLQHKNPHYPFNHWQVDFSATLSIGVRWTLNSIKSIKSKILIVLSVIVIISSMLYIVKKVKNSSAFSQTRKKKM